MGWCLCKWVSGRSIWSEIKIYSVQRVREGREDKEGRTYTRSISYSLSTFAFPSRFPTTSATGLS
jgi:hypothetical protein